jgi:hypothetical protein
MTMRRLLAAAVVSATLQLAAPAALLGQNRRPLPPAGDEGGVSPGELQNLFDAYALMQAQETLQLSDSQYPQFLARLKALQAARRRAQMDRARIVQQLRRLVQRSGREDETRNEIVERIRALREAEARAVAEVAAAVDSLDEVLDPLQQAKLRIFEEQMERRKLELLMRARQGARGRAVR